MALSKITSLKVQIDKCNPRLCFIIDPKSAAKLDLEELTLNGPQILNLFTHLIVQRPPKLKSLSLINIEIAVEKVFEDLI